MTSWYQSLIPNLRHHSIKILQAEWVRKPLAVFFVLTFLVGCSTASSNSTSFVSGDGSTTVLPVAERGEALVLSGTTLEGDELSVDQFLGKNVVINVWASWCAPCRQEAPELKAFHIENPDVQIVGINTRDNDPAARAFEEFFGITYPSIVDPDGSKQLVFRETLPMSAIPTTIVLDKSGRVSARILGAVTRSLLVQVVDEVNNG
ncbi:MAG: TlpA family protein disulfide reductase [Actinobacteria bacterium]|nr:TlpA family protein disulfide reductase [Actinomycetota bacterium]